MQPSVDPTICMAPEFLICGDVLAAGADVDSTTRFDMSDYEFVVVIVNMGTNTGTSTVVKLQDSADSSGGTLADISGESVTFADANDDEGYAMSVRTHGLKQYLSVNVAVTGGTSAVVAVTVIGVGPRQSRNLPSGKWDTLVDATGVS